MNHLRLSRAAILVVSGLALVACRRSSPDSEPSGGGASTTRPGAVELPRDAGPPRVAPNLNNPMVRTPPPAGGTPVVRRDGEPPENCPILVNDRCYATPREACAAAGCTTTCSILETYPGQVSCH